MKKRIFIDLDGVIADWEKTALKCLEVERNYIYPKLKFGCKVEDIFPDVYNQIDESEIDFWSDLEKLPWADVMIEKLKKYGDIAFLSSGGNPYKRTNSVADANCGKTKWVAKNFRGVPLILTREKYLCASKDTLLIDDTKSKIDDFIDYGGLGFNWPHPYALITGDVNLDATFKGLEEKIKAWN